MRRLLTFPCASETLAASIDDAAGATGATGLLIVSGGTQTRIGAHRGMARLAARVAAAGFPVFRFDRRGVGDSTGDDPGFADSAADLAAAAAAFRSHCPDVTRIIGFGLCDGATALALHHGAAGIGTILLANPWTVEPQAGLPPPAAIRRRYAKRLFSAQAWWRLISGGIDYRAALRGLRSASRAGADNDLAAMIAGALATGTQPAHILLASGDATAIAFSAEWRKQGFDRVRQARPCAVTQVETGSHSFANADEPEQMAEFCIAALATR